MWIGRGWEVAEALDVDLYRWFSEWSRTAGFGGLAAIVAATIAYFAARQNARRQERADRKAQWWARAQWALDLTLVADDEHAQEVGFGMLDALANSEWAEEHEGDVIAAATKPALEDAELPGSEQPAAEPADTTERKAASTDTRGSTSARGQHIAGAARVVRVVGQEGLRSDHALVDVFHGSFRVGDELSLVREGLVIRHELVIRRIWMDGGAVHSATRLNQADVFLDPAPRDLRAGDILVRWHERIWVDPRPDEGAHSA